MLVLSRKINQKIIVDAGLSHIEIVVCDIQGDRVKVGVQAPRSVAVHREEVYDAIQAYTTTRTMHLGG